MSSFEASNLSQSFHGGPPVSWDLSFRYEGSMAIGYLGPNGAGTTTTLHLLAGIPRPTSGHESPNGIDPRTSRRRALRDVGALLETPEPYPALNVLEALDAVGRARGVPGGDGDRDVERCHRLHDLQKTRARRLELNPAVASVVQFSNTSRAPEEAYVNLVPPSAEEA